MEAGQSACPQDPLLEHDPYHNGLDCQQHHTLLNNPGSLSFSLSQDDSHMSNVSKCYCLLAVHPLFHCQALRVPPAGGLTRTEESAVDLQITLERTEEAYTHTHTHTQETHM